MAQVKGIGGVFFKANDPKELAEWYAVHLGVELDPSFNGTCFHSLSLPAKSYSVWAPFPESTDYFAPSQQAFMINLIVDDLAGALAQVEEGGATSVGTPEALEFGKFGWFMDPEGNKVELWQPE
jgi:predicted enzyme related to lactoylglutathione lyase